MVRRYLEMAAAIAALGVGAGCADDGTSLRIECPVPPTLSNGRCTWSPESEVCVLTGRLNLAIGGQYQLVLKVTNGLVSRESEIPLRSEPNNMDVTSAEIELATTAGEPLDLGGLPNPYTVSTTGRVPVGGSGIASFQAIPPDYVQAIRDRGLDTTEGQIVIFVSLKAETDGLVNVSSRDWRWPVALINRPGSPVDCIVSDEAEGQCTPGQDDDLLPLCSNL